MSEQQYYPVNIAGFSLELPVLELKPGLKVAFFNLHGAPALTEHCAAQLAHRIRHADVILTAESKGLQLAHCIARNLGHPYYAVARKAKKLYMADGISVESTSITTGHTQTLYLSKHDTDLIAGKRVAIVDDVISTGGSLIGMEALIEKAGGTLTQKLFVLAEGDACRRDDIEFLAEIPLF